MFSKWKGNEIFVLSKASSEDGDARAEEYRRRKCDMAPSADSASLHLVSDADVDTAERRAISSWSGIAQGPKSEMHVTGTVAILKIFPSGEEAAAAKESGGLKIFCRHCFKRGKGENVGSIFRPLRMGIEEGGRINRDTT